MVVSLCVKNKLTFQEYLEEGLFLTLAVVVVVVLATAAGEEQTMNRFDVVLKVEVQRRNTFACIFYIILSN